MYQIALYVGTIVAYTFSTMVLFLLMIMMMIMMMTKRIRIL